ncbi:MAG: PD-(D/E)XK nuclease family protein [Nanoarchaeota archaeon]
MTRYSHSRISTFEQCKYKYKLQYIDKIKVDVPTTIEMFMGNLVHQALEKLYKDLQYQKLNTLKQLLTFYNNLWEKEYTDSILIVKDYSADNYKNMGIKFITTYYEHYKPFDQLTVLGLETQDSLTLPDGNSYHVRIDKLACKGDTYYVCDYKTNKSMKDQEQADDDRQLAMYSIWVKDKFKDAKKVILLWHMLAFDKEAVSERTDEQLKHLQGEVVKRIKEIESCKEFPTTVTNLCNYCVFKSICPSFKHEVLIEELSKKEFKDDEGVQIVNEFSKVKEDIRELETKEEQLKNDLIAFAKQKSLDVIYGSNKKASVKEYSKVVLPEDSKELISLLKKKGLYEEFSNLSYPKLNSSIVKGEMDKEVTKLTTQEKDYRINLSKRKDVDEE